MFPLLSLSLAYTSASRRVRLAWNCRLPRQWVGILDNCRHWSTILSRLIIAHRYRLDVAWQFYVDY